MATPKKRTELAGDWWFNPDKFYGTQEERSSGCIEWTGVTNNIGYGFIGATNNITGKGHMITTHRLALTIKLGRMIGSGLGAHHSCHNKLCVNPDHLSEGTQQQKMKQMRDDGFDFKANRGSHGAYNHRQEGRAYKYTIEEIEYLRYASLEEIIARYPHMSRPQASRARWSAKNGYRWLPLRDAK